jgi:hypothetical protein
MQRIRTFTVEEATAVIIDRLRVVCVTCSAGERVLRLRMSSIWMRKASNYQVRRVMVLRLRRRSVDVRQRTPYLISTVLERPLTHPRLGGSRQPATETLLPYINQQPNQNRHWSHFDQFSAVAQWVSINFGAYIMPASRTPYLRDVASRLS